MPRIHLLAFSTGFYSLQYRQQAADTDYTNTSLLFWLLLRRHDQKLIIGCGLMPLCLTNVFADQRLRWQSTALNRSCQDCCSIV